MARKIKSEIRNNIEYEYYDVDALHGTDAALSTSGKAADALATGRAIDNAKQELQGQIENIDICEIDATLSMSGKAADALATGEAIEGAKQELQEQIENIDAGVGFDSGYQDGSGFIHLTKNGEDLSAEDFTPFKVSGDADALHGTDTTLSISGKAADAFATGEAIDNAKQELQEQIENIDAGVGFDSGYQDGSGYIHLTKNGEDLSAEDFTPFKVSGDADALHGTDTTLSTPGKAADALATGEAIENAKQELQEQMENIDAGVGFDSGYQDDDGYIHLTKNGEDLPEEDFTPFKVAGGSGGGDTGSRLTFAIYTPTSFSVLDTAGTAPIRYKFQSIDTATQAETGGGTLAVYVGGVLKSNLNVQQGDNLVVDVFRYLTVGANEVRLVLTDSYGTSATRKFSIQRERFVIEWNLDEVTRNTNSNLSFYFTPTGTGTKTIYTYFDGQLYGDPDVVTRSGTRITKEITALRNGAHTIEVYGTMEVGGSTVESNHLHATIAQVTGSGTTPVIAVNWPSEDLQQYTTELISYMVIDPANNPTSVQLIADDVVLSTESVDQTMHKWAYRPTMAGTHTLQIKCGTVTVTHEVTVVSIGEGVEEVTNGLVIKVDPSSIGSLEEWSYGDYSFTLSENFDQVNGGLITDEEGVRCIRVTSGDRLTLNYKPFSGDPRRDGLEMKLIYTIRNSTNKEAEPISCIDSGIGLSVKANNAYLIGNQTTVRMSTCEDMKTELDINIQQDSDDQLVYIYESASTFSYEQYASNESYTQGTAQGITFGCDEADVYLYLLRGYNRDLTNNEIRENYIADGKDGLEILARQSCNDIYDSSGAIDLEKAYANNPNAHFIVINAKRMTLGKKDAVEGTIDHTYVAGGTSHKWSAPMVMKVQGTSSVEHAATAGPNINFTLPNGITLEDGTVVSEGYAMNGTENSIPTNLLCWKKNIASQDHIINRACAEWYNRYQPSVRQARIDDPRIRDCLESAMCVVFFHNIDSKDVQVGPDVVGPNETIFFGLGNLCSNKDAVEVFDYDDIVIEVKNNANDQVRFKSKDLSGNNWSENYEFRYLNEDTFTEEQAIAAWQTVQDFVYDTDITAATNTALPTSKTINGQVFTTDSVAYRKAKWNAEASTIFDMDTLYFHYNFTLFYLLRDNRAKNMFWSRNSEGKWGLWFNWDNDTGLCRNNDGYIDIEPGYMDFDTIGTGYVFNAADNALWTTMRECNMNQLTASYLRSESAGAWDIDAFYQYCKSSQDAICEALWLEDAQHNAIRTLQNLKTKAYLQRATGRLRLHIKKALMFQKVLVDSYYIATAATSESTAFRGYNPSEWSGVEPSGRVSVTTYTNMYVNVLAGSNSYRARATAGIPVELDISASLNNTEIYFRHAPWIQDLGDLSGLYLGQFEASNLKRIRRLLIGSSVAGYYNTNFTQATFDNCKCLVELNLGGLVNATRPFDFSPNIYLQKLYTKGSGITGITFAKNGRLREVQINAVASLDMRGLRQLTSFSIEDSSNLTALVIEECPLIDTYNITRNATNIARVRLLDLDWSVDFNAYKTLVRLYQARGIDDDGYDVEHGVLTGQVYFTGIGKTKYNTIRSMITTVTFTYGEELEEYTVTFQNYDGTTLIIDTSESGGSVADPVRSGLIETPTREATVEKFWVFYGWNKSLDNITEDTIITAVYSEYDQYYTVVFCNNDGTPIDGQTYTIIAHGSCAYSGEDLPAVDGDLWGGWQQETTDVVSDMQVMPWYIHPTLPAGVVSGHAYLYSDNPDDDSAYTLNEFYGIINSGNAKAYFSIGDKIKIVPNTTVFSDTEIILQVVGFNHFRRVDNDEFASVVFHMMGIMNSKYKMENTTTNSGGWPSSAMREWLNNTIFPELPQRWKSMIRTVKVMSSVGQASPNIVISEDTLFLPSVAEVGYLATDEPFVSEVDASAENRTFSVFTDSASRIRKYYNGAGSATMWWLRSPDMGNTFYRVVETGSVSSTSSYSTANSWHGVSFGFSI